MSTTLVAAARNAACDAIVDLVDGGAGSNGTIEWVRSDESTSVCSTDLSATAFGSAAAGVATLAGGSLDSDGATAGTIAYAQFKDKAGTKIWTDSVGTSGENINLSSVTLANNDVVRLTSYTFTVSATS